MNYNVPAKCLVVALLAATLLTGSAINAQSGDSAPPAKDEKQIIKTREVMELLFDPYYVDLRNALGKEPETRAEWRAIYVATFRLAEVNNLLFSRSDEDYMAEPEWRALSLVSRERTEALGEAVRKQDFAEIVKRYEAVIESCNACHNQFQYEPVEVRPFL